MMPRSIHTGITRTRTHSAQLCPTSLGLYILSVTMSEQKSGCFRSPSRLLLTMSRRLNLGFPSKNGETTVTSNCERSSSGLTSLTSTLAVRTPARICVTTVVRSIAIHQSRGQRTAVISTVRKIWRQQRTSLFKAFSQTGSHGAALSDSRLLSRYAPHRQPAVVYWLPSSLYSRSWSLYDSLQGPHRRRDFVTERCERERSSMMTTMTWIP